MSDFAAPITTGSSAAGSAPSSEWFALRAQPKHEHIAAAHLRQNERIQVFLPRIRFRRATRRGQVWVTEALFPNYLFARFNWTNDLKEVLHARGVSGVIHFGQRWPTIPHTAIAELRERCHDAEIIHISEELKPGDEVKITNGAFQGLLAVVQKPQSPKQRVAVLLEFLGRQTCIDVASSDLIRTANPRESATTVGDSTPGHV